MNSSTTVNALRDKTNNNSMKMKNKQKQTFDKQNTSGDETTPNNESATSSIIFKSLSVTMENKSKQLRL